MSKKLKVLTEIPADTGASALGGVGDRLEGVVEVALDTLTDEIEETLAKVNAIFSSAPVGGSWGVDSIQFNLKIDASGGVSLISLLNASATAGVGFTVTLNRRTAS